MRSEISGSSAHKQYRTPRFAWPSFAEQLQQSVKNEKRYKHGYGKQCDGNQKLANLGLLTFSRLAQLLFASQHLFRRERWRQLNLSELILNSSIDEKYDYAYGD